VANSAISGQMGLERVTALRAPSGLRLLRLGTDFFKFSIKIIYVKKVNVFPLYGNCCLFLMTSRYGLT
jgi:hypothetical protein